jgi:hypothetical protein
MARGARFLLFHVASQLTLELRPPVSSVASWSRIVRPFDTTVAAGAIRIQWAVVALAVLASVIPVRVD